MRFLVLPALLALAAVASASGCFPRCRFTLCSGRTSFRAGLPNVPLTSGLCLDGRRIGIAQSGEAQVWNHGAPVALSKWAPLGLRQRFSPYFFKAVPVLSGKTYVSGIGHESPQQNQGGFAVKRCFALHIRSFQALGPDGAVVDNVHTNNLRVDCVKFTLLPPLCTGKKRPKPSRKPDVVRRPPTPSPVPTTLPRVEEPRPEPPRKPEAGAKRHIPPSPTGGVIEPPKNERPPPSKKEMKKLKTGSGPTLKEKVWMGVAKRAANYTFMKRLVIGETSGVKEDLFLLTDSTRSMRDAIKTVQTRIGEIIAARTNGSNDVAFGIGLFRDEAEPGQGFLNLQPITKNVSAVQAATTSLKAIGGGDKPEGGLQALYRLATLDSIGWREGSRKIVAMFGDQPQHEPSCVGDAKLDRTNVIAALKAKGIIVVMVDVSGAGKDQGLNGKPTVFKCENATAGGVGQGLAISNATGGAFLENKDQTQVVDEIVKAVRGLDIKVAADTSDCDGKYQISFRPPLPTSIKQGEQLMLKQTVTVDPFICLSRSGTTCNMTITGDGGHLLTQMIGSDVVVGC